MSKKLLIVAAALLTSAVSFAQDWTAPEMPTTGSEVVSGHQYMVKSVAASEANMEGRFLAGGASWYSWATSTVVIDQAQALTFTLTNVEDKGWTFARTTDGKFTFISGAYNGKGEMHVDQGSQAENLRYFNIVKQDNGYYRIQASEYNSTYYNADLWWGWETNEEATFPNAIYGTVAEADGYGLDFEFLDMTTYQARLNLYNVLESSLEYDVDATEAAAVYNNADASIEDLNAAAAKLNAAVKLARAYAVLNGATEDDPKDGTSLIENPDFKTGNIDGWDNTFQGGVNGTNVGYQNNSSYSNGEAVISEGFIEAWANSAFNPNYTFRALGDGQLSQTLPSLPAGKYVLTGCFIANNQDGNKAASGKDLEGVQLFATAGEIDNHSNIATGNGKPELIALTFFSTGGDVTLGLRTSNTNANWIAGDNFTLTYYGEVAVDPHKAVLDAYIDECEQKFGDLEELKANKDVKDAFAAVLEEAKAATEDFEAVKDNLEAEAAKLQASVEEYVAFANELEEIQKLIAQAEESFADLAGELADYYDELQPQYEDCSATGELINGLAEEVSNKVRNFISENCKAGDDVTILLNNNAFDHDFNGWDMTGAGVVWQIWDGNGANTLTPNVETPTGGLAERWHAKFTMSQTIKNMPRGLYTLTCQGFNRHDDGEDNVSAQLYAVLPNGSVQFVDFKSIDDDATEEKLYDNGDWQSDSDRGGLWAPNSMTGSAWHFMNKKDGENYDYMNQFDITMTEAGDLTIGARCEYEHQWVIFDNFRIIYKGSGANVYADAIQKKIDAASAVGDNGTMTAEAEKVIDAAITAGEDAMAGDDEDACIAALNQLDEAIAFAKADQALVAELEHMFTTYNEYLIGEVESSDTEFSDILDKVSSKIDDAQFESQQEVKDLMDEIKAGWSTYVLADNLGATEEEPADVTPIIYNPKGVDPVTAEASANGWTGGNVGVDGNSMELYNQNYDFNQTLINLAPGFYRLKVNAFYRNHGWANRVDANDVDTLAHNAVLYAGEASTPLLVIKNDAEAYNEVAGVSEDGVWAIPTSMAEAATAFENELYQNILQFEVKEANAKTVIGIRKSEHIEGDWTIFTNFQLEYLGTTTPTEDPTTAIDGIEVAPATLVIYDIAGRRVSKAQKGVYVINGKKVIR